MPRLRINDHRSPELKTPHQAPQNVVDRRREPVPVRQAARERFGAVPLVLVLLYASANMLLEPEERSAFSLRQARLVRQHLEVSGEKLDVFPRLSRNGCEADGECIGCPDDGRAQVGSQEALQFSKAQLGVVMKGRRGVEAHEPAAGGELGAAQESLDPSDLGESPQPDPVCEG